MGNFPQDRFRRLAIVGSADGKQPPRPTAGQRWWGPKRPDLQETIEERAHFQSLSMAVMPTLSRGLWIEAIAWLRDFLRSYFVAGSSGRTGADVLPFRSQVLRARAFHCRQGGAEFASKKANGSVRWNRDAQEGGRG